MIRETIFAFLLLGFVDLANGSCPASKLLLLRFFFQLQIPDCDRLGGGGSCASAGAYQYGPDKCFLIVNTSETWLGSSDGPCQSIGLNFGNPSTQMGYSRIAVFTDMTMYNTVLDHVKPQQGSIAVWLGAQAPPGKGDNLEGYCWMTDKSTTGSQVGGQMSPVNQIGTSPANPTCLYIDTVSAQLYKAGDCQSGTNIGAICEFGKSEVTCILDAVTNPVT